MQSRNSTLTEVLGNPHDSIHNGSPPVLSYKLILQGLKQNIEIRVFEEGSIQQKYTWGSNGRQERC